MKITVARAFLLPALAAASRPADRKNTIPILSNLLLDSDGESLTIIGTNLDQEMTAVVPLVSGDVVRSTLPAVNLHDAVKTLPESAEVTIAFDHTHATVTSGKARFRLPVLPPEDFHAMPVAGWSHEFSLPAATIKTLFAGTSFAIEKAKNGRIYLQGIYLHATEDRLVAVATDGKKVARHFAALPEGAAGMPGVILPTPAIPLIESICDKGEVRVCVSDRKVRFSTDAAGIMTALVDGSFPDYERVIPKTNERRFTVNRAAMDAALARVTAIAAMRGSGVKFAFGTDGKVALATSDTEREANDEIECVAQSDADLTIGISGAFTRETLAACSGDEVTFAMADHMSPVVIEPVGNPDQLFVIMPMRI